MLFLFQSTSTIKDSGSIIVNTEVQKIEQIGLRKEETKKGTFYGIVVSLTESRALETHDSLSTCRERLKEIMNAFCPGLESEVNTIADTINPYLDEDCH